MKSYYLGLRVSSILFGLVAIVHLARILVGAQKAYIEIAGYQVGLIPSVVAIVVCGWLSLWLGKLACMAKKEMQPPPPAA